MLNLKSITIDDKKTFDQKINHEYVNSEASFSNLFMWRHSSKTKFAFIDDALCVFYTKSNGFLACCYPFGMCDIKNTILKIKDCFDSQNSRFIMESVPEECASILKDAFGEKITITETPNLHDYVYLSDKLINLTGKKLHSKRNHINKFKSLYSYQYKSITSDMLDECLNNAKSWLLEKYSESDADYKSEIAALSEVFENYDKLNLTGGALVVDDKIIAFSIGEKLTDDTFVIHIEKANTAYHGAYAVINNEFAINECKNFKYINREEDMGLDGLRKAKLSYQPDLMIKKYKIEYKE